MERENEVRLGKLGEESGTKHGLCAADGFFGGLADQDDRPAPAILKLRQHARGAEKNRHVQVVAASMHYADFATARTRRSYVAGIRQSGVLNNRKRVHVGSNVHHWPRPIFQDRDDAVRIEAWLSVLAEMIGDFVAGFLQVRGDQRRSLFFLRRKLRIFVQMFVRRQQRVRFLVDALVQIVLRKERPSNPQRANKSESTGSKNQIHRSTSKKKRHLSTCPARRRPLPFTSSFYRSSSDVISTSACDAPAWQATLALEIRGVQFFLRLNGGFA